MMQCKAKRGKIIRIFQYKAGAVTCGVRRAWRVHGFCGDGVAAARRRAVGTPAGRRDSRGGGEARRPVGHW